MYCALMFTRSHENTDLLLAVLCDHEHTYFSQKPVTAFVLASNHKIISPETCTTEVKHAAVFSVH